MYMCVWEVGCSHSLGPRPKPTPARIASSITRDTESDPRWGWFGSGAKTIVRNVVHRATPTSHDPARW